MVERRSADEGKVPGAETKASRRVLVSLDLENLGTLAEFRCVDGRNKGGRSGMRRGGRKANIWKSRSISKMNDVPSPSYS